MTNCSSALVAILHHESGNAVACYPASTGTHMFWNEKHHGSATKFNYECGRSCRLVRSCRTDQFGTSQNRQFCEAHGPSIFFTKRKSQYVENLTFEE